MICYNARMNEPIMVFQQGGWAMWAVLAIGLPAWFFTAIAAGVLMLKREPLPLMLGGLFPALSGVLAILVGAIGYFLGMSMAADAIAMADPQVRDLMMAEAERVAVYPFYLGLVMGVIPSLIGGVCFALALTLRKSDA